jgi:alcohol dehydrogenase class IV
MVPAAPHETIMTWQAPPVKFGLGATEDIGYELTRMGARFVLIVTDANLARLGLPGRIAALVEGAGIGAEIFDGVEVEPTDTGCERAAAELAHLAHQIDIYIGVGGGSSIDTAKMLNLLHSHPGAVVQDYLNPPIGAGKPVRGPLKPLVAVPTTAGSGSECTSMVALGVTKLRVKTGIADTALRPALALVDPLNTLTMPPGVTASTGYDVLTHACESYTARPYNHRPPYATPAERPIYIGSNPISDVWAERALDLVGRFLRRSVFNPADLEARVGMAQAAMFAGLGFGNAGTHIPHADAYPIAGLASDYQPRDYQTGHPLVPHGEAVISTAAAAFEFTYPACPERHLAAARLLGADLAGVSVRGGADVLPQTLLDLLKDTGGPSGIAAFGYDKRDIPDLVEGAVKQQRLLKCCPRDVGPDELTRIFEAAISS